MAAADEVTQIVAVSHIRATIGDLTNPADADKIVAALIAAADVELMSKAGRLNFSFDLKRKAAKPGGAS